MSGPDAFAGVWQPGTGTQWVRAGLSWDQFKTQDKTYFDQGLRITSLAIRDGMYTAVWRPGGGAQWVRPNLSWDEFKGHDATYFAQGLRIGSLAIENGRYTAVWRAGGGAQWCRPNLSWDEFKGHDATYFAQGLRVTTLEYEGGKYTAVWRPGSGTQWIRGGMSFGDFVGQDRTYFAQGLRITALAYDKGRYAAVWRTGTGAQWWSSRRGMVDFVTEDTAYFQRGLRLVALELQDDPVGAYKYPWTGGVTYTCGQGNNTSGSHNPSDSQAWAFDFSLPAGTTIRAARGGTVEWLQENLTATYNPNLPNGPGNMPFPAGSLQNWGNAIRIRHAGGFTSWYFHIQSNGVLVNVGDEVTQGQAIATSGNTGRSSGAHLHFQVQADSTDWGQSVAHTFGADCEQPASGDSVTSDNSS